MVTKNPASAIALTGHTESENPCIHLVHDKAMLELLNHHFASLYPIPG